MKKEGVQKVSENGFWEIPSFWHTHIIFNGFLYKD